MYCPLSIRWKDEGILKKTKQNLFLSGSFFGPRSKIYDFSIYCGWCKSGFEYIYGASEQKHCFSLLSLSCITLVLKRWELELNHRIVWVGRDIWGSSNPNPLHWTGTKSDFRAQSRQLDLLLLQKAQYWRGKSWELITQSKESYELSGRKLNVLEKSNRASKQSVLAKWSFQAKWERNNCDSEIVWGMGQKVFLQLLKYSAFRGGGKPYFNGFLEWKWWKKPMKARLNSSVNGVTWWSTATLIQFPYIYIYKSWGSSAREK